MADPLSVVASIIGVATAAAQIGKAISRLRHLGELPGRVYALKNEISDLEVVLRQVAHALERGFVATDDQQTSLNRLLAHAKNRLADLTKALERLSNVCDKGKIKVISKSTIWWREKVVFHGFQQDLRAVKESFILILGATNSYLCSTFASDHD